MLKSLCWVSKPGIDISGFHWLRSSSGKSTKSSIENESTGGLLCSEPCVVSLDNEGVDAAGLWFDCGGEGPLDVDALGVFV